MVTFRATKKRSRGQKKSVFFLPRTTAILIQFTKLSLNYRIVSWLSFVLYNSYSLDIYLYWAVRMLIFWLPGQKYQISPEVNILPSTEEILCTTGFYTVWLVPKEQNMNEHQTSRQQPRLLQTLFFKIKCHQMSRKSRNKRVNVKHLMHDDIFSSQKISKKTLKQICYQN